jgi:ParB-like nuclease domain
MKLIDVEVDELVVSSDLARSRSSKVFEDHLRASIDVMGLAEPLKVALLPSGAYLVVDGMIRLRAIQKIRSADPSRFDTVPAYVVDHARRYELRYQTDIYQDLLPSQLATLVEHLHEAENVRKVDIARYIGVSPATLRNYTGLWRLIQRGGLFAQVVELMDAKVLPASNPYAWLRLTDEGLRDVLELLSGGQPAEEWIHLRIARARRGDAAPYSLQDVEVATGSLPADRYRETEDVRSRKRDLGLRRAGRVPREDSTSDVRDALRNLRHVSEHSPDPVLREAALSLATYLQ